MTDTEDFWSNRFHWCALAAGFRARAEGRLHESDYVRQLAYDLFEGGAFREQEPGRATLDSADKLR